ncbi:MAG TPA: NAD(P)H-hydrate dehydratase [Steroidobacteraceae bacterium]|nr:NAD(P)H-hydrate dehydratase [Steroidobacteraceae bacterium]
MSSLPLEIYSAAELRALDRRATEEFAISGYALMCRAGEAALATLRSCWPAANRIVVACGPGNNGGDGYVLARLARADGLQVSAVTIGDPERLSGAARQAYRDYVDGGGSVPPWSGAVLQADVIVDALFGIGLARPIEGTAANLIDTINRSRIPILAIDVPSGLHTDTGQALGVAVHAERTITFIGLKLGFYLGDGPDYTGAVMFDSLELPEEVYRNSTPSLLRIDDRQLKAVLPMRKRTAHKGQQGAVLVVGGGIGMAGAARMAAEAALRSGAGLVTIATHPDNVAAVIAGRPELMCRGVNDASDLQPLIERADLIAIGPGLGRDEWAKRVFDVAIASEQRKVVDADGLNLLAASPRHQSNWVLTPHPGEAGRLLGITNGEVQHERLRAVRSIAARYGGVVVLKGAGTLIATADQIPAVCDRGNPGMASPGMGDVLTGVISGIAAQVPDLATAAQMGVLVHAMAGDMAARHGERGLLATDLFSYLPACVNPTQRI